MPRVTPFYAVKCNPDAAIMRCLAALGCGFDCASAREMADVLAMGVPPRRIIFAQPCKCPADLGYAAAAGVTVRLRSFMYHIPSELMHPGCHQLPPGSETSDLSDPVLMFRSFQYACVSAVAALSG